MAMTNLPGDLWRKILEMGVERSGGLDHRDLVCLSISCTLFRRLSSEPLLWTILLERDFPSSPLIHTPNYSPDKSLYKNLFNMHKTRRLVARRVRIMKLKSLIAETSKRLEGLNRLLAEEHSHLKSLMKNIADLEKFRCTSVAQNVWQPELIRTSQSKMLVQTNLSFESGFNVLKMEIQVCKQQIMNYRKAYEVQKLKLAQSEKALIYFKYHPVHGSSLEKDVNYDKIRKRLKRESRVSCS
ncbi:F-box protein SKIP24 [Zostera marina]|uniref:F-box protein SKIP24 n=1 Tax=Zostera marina TaxID=29655 RepID=A0A0K9P343_ZOSMR|nr:F-box protein SKIP24 [Zostera marina]